MGLDFSPQLSKVMPYKKGVLVIFINLTLTKVEKEKLSWTISYIRLACGEFS